MRIGIDVGGTNTDAVVMDGALVLGEVKTTTTADVTSGIATALKTLVEQSNIEASQVRGVMIGTTHFTNAVVEARRLMPTATVRLGLPATQALPPLVDWPERLRSAVGGQAYLCHGGHEFDGRPISPLDHDELKRAASDIEARGIRSVAISSVFSPVNDEFELEAAAIIQDELPGIALSLSHEIGRVGLLERENATIMNACLRDLADRIVDGFATAVGELAIDAPVYVSQNDGTLMSMEYTRRYPVATFASGPTNSMRGAALLSGVEDCAVIDVGGTTSDIGVLKGGFPREASLGVEVGGVRTNFRMPDVLSIGLGGGSHVRTEPELTIGPDSVGYELATRARVFGGSELTATDVAVAAGRAQIGDAACVSDLSDELTSSALAAMNDQLAGAVDRMKTSSEPLPVVAVGGGSILVGDAMPGVSELLRPDHFSVANAVGAAIGQIGGEVDRVFSMEEGKRDEVIDEARGEAVDRAVGAGATASTVEVVDIEEVPLAYLPSNAVRIRVKAVGDLALT